METRNATRPPTAMAWHRGCHRQTGTRRVGCPRGGLLGAPLSATEGDGGCEGLTAAETGPLPTRPSTRHTGPHAPSAL